MDGVDASPMIVELWVFFVVFVFVIVLVGGACLCAKQSTTLDLLELLAFFVISAFLLGAIWTLDGNGNGEIEVVISTKKKQE